MVMVVADELEVVFECSDICSEHVHFLDISWPLLSDPRHLNNFPHKTHLTLT